jgi:hypothetical protein
MMIENSVYSTVIEIQNLFDLSFSRDRGCCAVSVVLRVLNSKRGKT